MKFDFVNQLKSKKEFDEIMLKQFNKWWYNGLEDDIINYVKNIVYISNNINQIFNFDILNFYFEYLHEYGCDISKNLSQIIFAKLVRSKLWNLGLNVVADSNGTIFIKIRSDEKYSDCFVSFDDYDNNFRTVGILNDLSIFSDLTIGEVQKRFKDNLFINLSDNTIKKKEKNVNKKKIEKPDSNNTDGNSESFEHLIDEVNNEN